MANLSKSHIQGIISAEATRRRFSASPILILLHRPRGIFWGENILWLDFFLLCFLWSVSLVLMNFIWFVYALLKTIEYVRFCSFLCIDQTFPLMLLSSVFFPHHCLHSFGYCLHLLLCLFPFDYLLFFACFFILFTDFSFLFPSPSLSFISHTHHPLHSSFIQLGEERCNTSSPACQPTEDIYSSSNGGQDKDYLIRWNTFKKHLQWHKALTRRRREKKKRNHVKTTTVTNANNKMLFVTWHGFLINFPYFEEKLPPETAAGRSDTGSKAVMTFLTAPRLNPKGILRSTSSQENWPVANRDLCANELYGGRPHVGLCESLRERVWTVSIHSSLCFSFAFFFSFSFSLFIRCLLSVMSNRELCFSPTVCSWGCLKGFVGGLESLAEDELKIQ